MQPRTHASLLLTSVVLMNGGTPGESAAEAPVPSSRLRWVADVTPVGRSSPKPPASGWTTANTVMGAVPVPGPACTTVLAVARESLDTTDLAWLRTLRPVGVAPYTLRSMQVC